MTDEKQLPANSKAYLWNTTAGLLVAFQSVILLVVITRVCDLVTAGVFTIAYAHANLFLNMGKYGVRNFQVSDTAPRFSFADYEVTRIVTSIAMIACSFAYLAYSAVTLSYDEEKWIVIALMCLFKAVDSIEDVFCGNFQQNGHLDVAGKYTTARLATTITVFVICLVASTNLAFALGLSTAYTALFLAGALVRAHAIYHLPVRGGHFVWAAVWRILKECFPLFLAAFLLFYIGNAPKYAIDALLGDSLQALYGFIAMPVFVVGLFAGFIYSPLIAPLSHLWSQGDIGGFTKTFARQSIGIICMTLGCVSAAWFAGTPVLGLLYNTDLSSYVVELCVLVVGGGFLAFTNLFTVGITIIRCQTSLVWGYASGALFALFGSSFAVNHWGIMGAAVVYLASMVVLAAWFAVVFALGIKSESRISQGNS